MNESDSPQTIETPQPVAWRAYDTDGSEAVYSLYEQARAAADEMNWSVEPLYRSLTLTDAEREAVEWYAGFVDGIHAATLRNLLDRLVYRNNWGRYDPWIPNSVRMPPVGEWVLCYSKQRGCETARVEKYWYGWVTKDKKNLVPDAYTHWMPMPPPPGTTP